MSPRNIVAVEFVCRNHVCRQIQTYEHTTYIAQLHKEEEEIPTPAYLPIYVSTSQTKRAI